MLVVPLLGTIVAFEVLANYDAAHKSWLEFVLWVDRLGVLPPHVLARFGWALVVLLLSVIGAAGLVGKKLLAVTEGQESSKRRKAAPRAGHSEDVRVRGWLVGWATADVTARLCGSLREANYASISVDEQRGLVAPPFYVVDESGQRFNDFSDAFDAAGGQILLLGKPGAGKTTAVLHLARSLLDRSSVDEKAPVPVFLNLSGYSARARRAQWLARWLKSPVHEEPVRDWVVESIAALSVQGLGRRRIRKWLDDGTFALLLDGLDEVDDRHIHRVVEDLNDFLRTYSRTSVVVGCRTAEYKPIGQQKSTRLVLARAVELQPLTPDQVRAFLTEAGAVQLVDVLQQAEWAELATTPLFLSIIALAYSSVDPATLTARISATQRNERLFDAYIQQMLQRTARRKAGVPFDMNPERDCAPEYSPKQIYQHLGWIAVRLSEKFRTVFPLRHLTDFLTGVDDDAAAGAARTALSIRLVQLCCVFGALAPAVATRVPLLLWVALPPLGVLLYALDDDARRALGWPEWLEQVAIQVLMQPILFLTLGLIGHALATALQWPDGAWPLLAAFLLVAYWVGSLVDKMTVGRLIVPAVTAAVVFSLTEVTSLGIAIWIGVAVTAALSWYIEGHEGDDAPAAAGGAFALAMVTLLAVALVGWLGHAVSLALLAGIAIVALIVNGFAAPGMAMGVLLIASQLVPPYARLPMVAVALVLLIPPLAGGARTVVNWAYNPVCHVILAACGWLPWRARAFLDHGVDAFLLKRAGRDVEFVHRRVRDHFAIRALTLGMDSASPSDQIERLLRLGHQGEAGVDYLGDKAQAADARIRQSAVAALGRIPDPRVPLIYQRVLLDPDPNSAVRAEAARGVQRMPEDSARQILELALNDPSPDVRMAALRSSRRRFSDYWQRGITDRHPEVVGQALALMGDAAWALDAADLERLGLTAELLRAHDDAGDPEVRGVALTLLARLAPEDAERRAHALLRKGPALNRVQLNLFVRIFAAYKWQSSPPDWLVHVAVLLTSRGSAACLHYLERPRLSPGHRGEAIARALIEGESRASDPQTRERLRAALQVVAATGYPSARAVAATHLAAASLPAKLHPTSGEKPATGPSRSAQP
jgi:hypothetical protein